MNDIELEQLLKSKYRQDLQKIERWGIRQVVVGNAADSSAPSSPPPVFLAEVVGQVLAHIREPDRGQLLGELVPRLERALRDSGAWRDDEPTKATAAVRPLRAPATSTGGWSRTLVFGGALLCVCLVMVAYSAYGVGKAEAAKVIARLESELAASLERLRKRPAIDPVQQFEKGREFSVLQGEHPTQVVLRLSPFLGMPYYAGMDVDWGDSEQDKLYFAGKSPELESQLVHTYTIDSGGQQSFNVVLTFYRSGEAMASLDRSQDANRSQTVKESFTLRVSEAGVRVVSGPDANVLSASITNPGQDDAVVSQPEPIIRMLLKAPPQAQPSPRQPDRVVHLVVRALDGPPEAREFSFIQPFSLSLASLVQAGGDSEHSFDTWVSLPGVELLQPPTRFEILLVELPVALVQQRIDRRIMDFDDPAVRREVVRAERVIRYVPKSEGSL